MEFYKSRNSSSTSSNASNSSHKPLSSMRNANTFSTLEYCSSSSSMSPFGTSSACQASSIPTVVTISIDDLVIPTSCGSSSHSSVVYPIKTTAKRKRLASHNSNEKDSELCFEPPLAKRQQRIPSFYQSEPDSIVSSVYPSPADELVHEIDTRSSSDCQSTSTEFDVVADDIPDSPNSLQADDNEFVSRKTSPSGSSKEMKVCQSYPTVFRHNYHGERTPSQKQSDLINKSNTLNTSNSSNTTQTRLRVKSFDEYFSSHYCMTPTAEVDPQRLCPLPALSWANAQDVWELMCRKDEQATCFRNSSMLEHHPSLQPRMRAILLDWLIEVCEVYKLHRETYYLAVDYLDRYLNVQKKVQKTHLQLIGITCLFIAAKVEEIYPPKIGEFAYVTDGACQEEDILQHEILLLQTLEWSISPVTAMGWLGIYMQLNVNNRTPASFTTNPNITHDVKSRICEPLNPCQNRFKNSARQQKSSTSKLSIIVGSLVEDISKAFIFPQFSGMEFVQTAQLLDLCSLDVSMGNYPYSIIAAAAISHTFNRETALRCSGLDWVSIQPCARWMEPFFEVICEESNHLHLLEQGEPLPSKYGMGYVCPNIVTDDSHIIQTHTTTMTMFDRACLLKEQREKQKYFASKFKQEASPATGFMCPEGLLTPPASSRKPVVNLENVEIDAEQTSENIAVKNDCNNN